MQQLAQLLEAAYGGSKEQRTEATASLQQMLQAHPHDAVLALLDLGCNSTLGKERCLSALLYLKNYVLHDMNAATFRNTTALESLKERILSALPTLDEKCRRVVLEVVRTIVSEFTWNYFPQLLPVISSFDTASGQVEFARALLETAYVLTKRFKTPGLEPMEQKLAVCKDLAEQLPKFFALQDMFTTKMTFKIFECITETFQQMPSKQMAAHIPISESLLSNWLTYLGSFPRQFHTVATAAGGAVYEVFVACVKRIGGICFSILSDATKKKKASAIATYFLENFSIPFFQMWVEWLAFCLSSTTDRSIHRKSEIFAIRYIKMATMEERIYTSEIKPRALEIVERYLFPYMCLQEADEDIFNDEAALQEYAQYILDENVYSGEFSQRQAASNAVIALVGGKRPFHDPQTLPGLLQILHTGLSQPSDDAAGAKRSFGFLHLLSILRKSIKDQLPGVWSSQMEGVLANLVAPRIHSPFVFVKCKAIYACQVYCKIPWTDEALFSSFVASMATLVGDGDARVRLSTIDAMCVLLEMRRARPYLRHVLVPLVNEALSFLDKVQTTYVPLVLNYLAEHFAAELTPVLDKLVAALVRQFLAATFDIKAHEQHDNVDLNDEDQLKAFETLGLSAYQSMSAINNIVISTEYNKQALAAMLPDVMRLVKAIFLEPDSFEYMDKAIEIFQHVVFMTKPVPQECWELFPVVYKCVMSTGTGVDYFASFEGVLDNFVSNAPEAYLGNADVMRMTYEMCEKMLIGGVVAGDKDIIASPQLIEALLHQAKHCSSPALMSPYLTSFVTLLLRALGNGEIQSKGVSVRMWLITAMMDAFYFDAASTLQVIIDSGAYPHFFMGYFDFFGAALMEGGSTSSKKKSNKGNAATATQIEVIDTLTVLFRKVNVLGLTSLLNITTNPSSAYAASFDPAINATAVRLILYFMEANAKAYAPRCKNLAECIEKVKSGFEEDHEDFDEEDMDLQDEDDQEGDITNADQSNDVDDEEDEDDGLEPEETDDYYTPIDQVCEVAFFRTWLCAIRGVASPVLQQLASAVPAEAVLDQAQQVSSNYIALVAALHVANEEDHQRRAAAAATPQGA